MNITRRQTNFHTVEEHSPDIVWGMTYQTH